MTTSVETRLSRQEIERHAAHIATALGEPTAGDDLTRLADAGRRLQLLRSQYRACPNSLNGYVPKLTELSQQFDTLLETRLPRIVDRFHEVSEQIRRAQYEKDFWREHLIAQCPTGRRESLHGADADVVVRSTESRLLPPAKTEHRAQLDRLVRESGHWTEVSQLSRSKLQQALAKALFGPAQRQAIEELCPLTVVHQVTSRPRTG